MNNEYLEVLEKKVLSAMKKNNDEIFEKWEKVINASMKTKEDFNKLTEIFDCIERELKPPRPKGRGFLRVH